MAILMAAFAVLVVVSCAGLLFYLAYNAKKKKAIQMPGDVSLMQGVQRAKTTSILYMVLGGVVLAMTPCCGGCTLMLGWSIESKERKDAAKEAEVNSTEKRKETNSSISSKATSNTGDFNASKNDSTKKNSGSKSTEKTKPGIFAETPVNSSKDQTSKDAKAKEDAKRSTSTESDARMEAMKKEAAEMRKKFDERRKNAE